MKGIRQFLSFDIFVRENTDPGERQQMLGRLAVNVDREDAKLSALQGRLQETLRGLHTLGERLHDPKEQEARQEDDPNQKFLIPDLEEDRVFGIEHPVRPEAVDEHLVRQCFNEELDDPHGKHRFLREEISRSPESFALFCSLLRDRLESQEEMG